jgi:translation initiation factor RLI1
MLFGYAHGAKIKDERVELYSLVMVEPAGNVLCLVGFPGVGKLTIARILARMTGAVLVDNHWINDPILRLGRVDEFSAAELFGIPQLNRA